MIEMAEIKVLRNDALVRYAITTMVSRRQKERDLGETMFYVGLFVVIQ